MNQISIRLRCHTGGSKDRVMAMAAEPVPDAVWDEHQAYEELLYWDSLIQRGHRLLPHDFDRCFHTHTEERLLAPSKMLVCRYHLSRWIFVLLICYLQFWDTVSSDPLPAIPPTPSLTQASSVGNTILGAVVLVCQAPEGPGGTLFRLHRVKKLVDSITFPSERQEARFTVRVKEDSAREDIYCCLYQNSQGMYSSYSHYMTLKQQVDPPGGQVKRGQTLSFHCSPPPPHSQQSPKPEAFLLLWTAKATGDSVVYPQASLASRSTAQTGAFRLGPVRGGEGGSYTCLYQVTVPCQGPTNSTASHPVLVTVTELLPVPTLSLQRQAGEWALVCTGSPAFPGARFSLYQLGSSFPDATRSAPVTRHRALFALSSLPAQDGPLSDQYQCQYSALLGAEWSHSERSPPLAVSRVIEKTTTSPPSSPGNSLKYYNQQIPV
ncbi:unnamed protein product [Coregonus sp. 'balchen']|nr:unnamed protein product [Coregonus sp. 'balchen']